METNFNSSLLIQGLKESAINNSSNNFYKNLFISVAEFVKVFLQYLRRKYMKCLIKLIKIKLKRMHVLNLINYASWYISWTYIEQTNIFSLEHQGQFVWKG